jgi:hypothetical protein
MPQESNAVTLHATVKDQNGQPVPNVHFGDHPNDIAMRNHAYARGAAVYDAAGAVRTFPTPPYPSTHNLGTNRMSAKARDGVVNRFKAMTLRTCSSLTARNLPLVRRRTRP